MHMWLQPLGIIVIDGNVAGYLIFKLLSIVGLPLMQTTVRAEAKTNRLRDRTGLRIIHCVFDSQLLLRYRTQALCCCRFGRWIPTSA